MFDFSLPAHFRLVIDYDDVPSRGHFVLYQISSLEFSYNNGGKTPGHVFLMKAIVLTY